MFLNDGTDGLIGFGIGPDTAGNNLFAYAWDGTTQVAGTTSLAAPPANGSTNTTGSNLGDVKFIVGELSFNTGTGGADVFNFYNVTNDGTLGVDDLVLIDSIEIDLDESTIDTLSLTRQVNLNWDEVRVTTSVEEALGFPIPEPSSLALLGLGGLLVARRRRS